MKRCPQCDADLVPRPRESPAHYGLRKYCSRPCANRARRATSRTYIVEDVEDLLGMGESVEQIPSRLGRTIAAVEIALRRAGRPDLARLFARVLKRQRTQQRRAS